MCARIILQWQRKGKQSSFTHMHFIVIGNIFFIQLFIQQYFSEHIPADAQPDRQK